MQPKRQPASAFAALIILTAAPALAASHALEAQLHRIAAGFDGRVGVCVRDAAGAHAVNATQRFSLQSVMKLIVAAAVLDSVDRGERRLDDTVVVRRQDLSLYVQPIAKLVREAGFKTTVQDLIRRAVVDSDSAATDVLIAQLGGTHKVQDFLRRNKIEGVRVDRDEKRLQTEILGLTWKPEYVDAEILGRAIHAVPQSRRDQAYRAYQADERDTATPDGMAALLPSPRGRCSPPTRPTTSSASWNKPPPSPTASKPACRTAGPSATRPAPAAPGEASPPPPTTSES